MKIVVAPDSFKGSMSAQQACQAMAEGIGRVLPSAEVVSVPMADGGEGTTEAMVAATGGRMREVQATGPLGEKVIGRVGLLGDDRTAVLEMACVSGLPLVPPGRRNPLHTTTYGTGELIAAALDAGARRLIVGIGGSATTDLGAGMAQALGAKFFSSSGAEITQPMTGALLADVARVDLSGLHPAVTESRIEVACDVDNPLLGPRGSAAVYAPQKGAGPDDVQTLEANLAHAVEIVEAEIGRAVRDTPGAGAAGGLGAGLMAFLAAKLRPGIDLLLEASGLAEKLRGADLLLTGEGRIDSQTAYGKTISGVARTARQAGVPVVALVGSIGEGVENLYEIGVTSMFSICPGPIELDNAIAEGPRLLLETCERFIRIVQSWQTK